MPTEGYTAIGTFLNPHGYKGKISVFLNIKKFNTKEPIFVNLQQTLVPFFIEEFSSLGNKAILKIQDVDSEQQALQFKKKEFFVKEDSISKFVEKENPSLGFIGYEVYDANVGFIGVLNAILEYPGQDIFKILSPKNEEILIPVADYFIQKINKKAKKIFVTTPEGLLDLYISKE